MDPDDGAFGVYEDLLDEQATDLLQDLEVPELLALARVWEPDQTALLEEESALDGEDLTPSEVLSFIKTECIGGLHAWLERRSRREAQETIEEMERYEAEEQRRQRLLDPNPNPYEVTNGEPF